MGSCSQLSIKADIEQSAAVSQSAYTETRGVSCLLLSVIRNA